MKIGIFIQGPIISRGRTGESLSSDPLIPGPKSTIESFNCIKNINDSYKHYSDYFDEVLVTMWKSDLIYLPRLQIPRDAIIVIEDIEDLEDLKYFQTFHNSQRQYVSSLAAIEELSRRECDAIIKTRSDQFLDAFSLAMNLIDPKNQNLILFPYRDESNFDLISDFYIGGPTRDLLEIFTSLVSGPQFSLNVHFDIYYKTWIKFQNQEEFKIRLHRNPRYFDEFARPIISKFLFGDFSKYLISMDKKWIGTFDSMIWENLIWRGKRPMKLNATKSNATNEDTRQPSFLKVLILKALIGKF